MPGKCTSGVDAAPRVYLHKALCKFFKQELRARGEAEKVAPIFTRAAFSTRCDFKSGTHTLSLSRRALHRVTDGEGKKSTTIYINAVALSDSAPPLAISLESRRERKAWSLFALADWHMRRICKNSIWPARPLSISALSHSRPTFVAKRVLFITPRRACLLSQTIKMHEGLLF
jgi:hypothetical protein